MHLDTKYELYGGPEDGRKVELPELEVGEAFVVKHPDVWYKWDGKRLKFWSMK